MTGLLNQLSEVHPETAATLVGVLTVASLVALLIGALIIRRYVLKRAELDLASRRLEAETDLKEKMLDRGFSADEIERVLASRIAEDGSRLAKAV